MNYKYLLFISALLSSITLSGQLPASNLLMFDMNANEQVVLLKNPILLTSFNIEGYNNQPSFRDADHILFTSNYDNEAGTDIYEINLLNKSLRRVTSTVESEFSPIAYKPGHFSVVSQSVDNEGDPSQLLWSFDLSNKVNEGPILTDYNNVGYYCWLSDHLVALYLVGEPNQLIVQDLNSGMKHQIATNISRSFKRAPDGSLVYLRRLGNSWSYHRWDINEKRSSFLAQSKGNEQDFELLRSGNLITSQGSTLYILKNNEKAWSPIFDMADWSVKKITRIASSLDKIVIVVEL